MTLTPPRNCSTDPRVSLLPVCVPVGRQLAKLLQKGLAIGLAGLGRRQRRLQPVAWLAAGLRETRLTEILEGLVLSVPAVAVLVVFAGVGPGTLLPTGDAGHRLPVAPGPEHTNL